jgi:hypothetical protein
MGQVDSAEVSCRSADGRQAMIKSRTSTNNKKYSLQGMRILWLYYCLIVVMHEQIKIPARWLSGLRRLARSGGTAMVN